MELVFSTIYPTDPVEAVRRATLARAEEDSKLRWPLMERLPVDGSNYLSPTLMSLIVRALHANDKQIAEFYLHYAISIYREYEHAMLNAAKKGRLQR